MNKREMKLLVVVAVFAASIIAMLVMAFTGFGGEEAEWVLMLLFGAGFALLGNWIFDLAVDLVKLRKEEKPGTELTELSEE